MLAARVQQSLSPGSLAWRSARVETFCEPVRAIGGDFGLVAPNDDYLNLLVCDVSGHGISSALVANRIYAETISQIETGVGPEVLLRHLNHFLLQTLGDSSFYATLASVRLGQEGRRLEFSGAGHPPAMLIRPGSLPQVIESQSAMLGLLDDAVESGSTIDISVETGDRVLLYTDGFTESFDSEQQMLGVNGKHRLACVFERGLGGAQLQARCCDGEIPPGPRTISVEPAPGIDYSCRNASVGAVRAARRAGM